MKLRLILPASALFLSAGIPGAFACTCVTEADHQSPAVEPKTVWTQMGETVPARSDYASASFKGSLWIAGGLDERGKPTKDVWSSMDGKAWQKEGVLPMDSANHTLTEFRGKLWVIGGAGNKASATVFSSMDGKKWTTEAPLPKPLDSHAAVTFKGRLYVLGGHGEDDRKALRNVYATKDGKIWTEQGKNALPLAVINHAAVSHKGTLYVLGGGYPGHGTEPTRSMMTSTDGITWTEHANALPGSIYCLTTASFRGKLWLLGGLNGAGKTDKGISGDGHSHGISGHYRHAVHSTPDGKTWKEEPAFSLPLHAIKNTAVLHKGGLWVVGGAFSRQVYQLPAASVR